MPRTLRAAVIGLGSMGANHVRVLGDMPGVELVGVMDTDAGRIEQVTHGRVVGGFTSLGDLIRSVKPDIASIVVPTGLHERVGLEVITAGVGVLVEKPIAADLGGAARLADAARGKGVVLTVGHIERFNPAVRELKSRLREGLGGRVLQVRARRVGPFPQRIRDVGVIHDLAPHDIDVMRYLLDDEIDSVYASAQQRIHTDNEDIFAGMLHFRSGALGLLDINWLTPRKERTLTVLCEGGMFALDYMAQSLEFYENYAARAREGAVATVTEGPMTRFPVAGGEPLRLEMEAFRDSVLGIAPVAVTAADGIAALAVAEALVRSAREGARVSVASIGGRE
jgi:predicted dehydrogenase